MTDTESTLAVLAAVALTVLVALALVTVAVVRTMRQRDREAAERQMAEVARLQAETSMRIEMMRDMLAGRQAELSLSVSAGQAELARAATSGSIR
jgi:flagellar biosynthesis/type III secretory pathway M-ring protein FliF/YscJ